MSIRNLALFLVLSSAVVAHLAMASEAAHHAPTEIPWRSVGVQFFNLSLLIGVLGFVLRKKIKTHFQTRKETYLELVSRAENAKAQAEKNKREIHERLAKLEETAKSSVEKARSEAEDLKARIVLDAKGLAEKLRIETERAVEIELERAKLELRKELLDASVEAARKILNESIDGKEQKKLQDEFMGKIQAVR